MRKIVVLILMATLAMAVSGCKSSHSGSREYVPGKGWIYTD